MRDTAALAREAGIFKALGHPARLRMVHALAGGAQCVCELTELVGSDMSTISRHLGQLKAAGVVSDERRGNRIYYRLELPCVATLLGCVAGQTGGATPCCSA